MLSVVFIRRWNCIESGSTVQFISIAFFARLERRHPNTRADWLCAATFWGITNHVAPGLLPLLATALWSLSPAVYPILALSSHYSIAPVLFTPSSIPRSSVFLPSGSVLLSTRTQSLRGSVIILKVISIFPILTAFGPLRAPHYPDSLFDASRILLLLSFN